jgi:hypothetical protein
MNPEKQRHRLHGWDDEKIYFWDDDEKKEWCVTDEEDLHKKLLEICVKYFEKKKADKGVKQ